MDSQNIAKSLIERFQIPAKGNIPNRVVIWNDAEESFVDEIDEIANMLKEQDIETIKVDLSGRSYLLVKKQIELDEPSQKFLLYFTTEVPKDEDDWFLDTRLYGGEFHADKAALAMVTLGLNRMALRTHIASRELFLANKRRVSALKNFIVENDNEDTIDLKMIAVTVGVKSATIEAILLALFKQLDQVVVAFNNIAEVIENSEILQEIKVIQEIDKYGLRESFWRFVGDYFGYLPIPEEAGSQVKSLNRDQTLLELLKALFATELAEQINSDQVTQKYRGNILALPSGRATALVFLDNWRDSREFSDCYQTISKLVAIKLGVRELFTTISEIDPALLTDSMSFVDAEYYIIKFLVEQLCGKAFDNRLFEEIINIRSIGYWAITHLDYKTYYKLLLIAKKYLELSVAYLDDFSGKKIAELFKAYNNHYYQVDQLYRQYITLYSKLKDSLDLQAKLTPLIEKNYINQFSSDLSRAWDDAVKRENFLSRWRIGSDATQEEFFKKRVVAEKEAGNLKRIYVIISDALRFEVAKELQEKINDDGLFKADIQSQLGVIPSYTQLGMAALLPHTALSYKTVKEGTEYSTTVFADGVSTAGLAGRKKILEKVNGIAFNANEILNFSREAEKNARGDAEYIYIYHDSIDAIGDDASTEGQTFKACEQAIEELQALIRKIINTFNGSRILITADHGFIYQHEKLDSNTDKTELRLSEENHTFVTKKKRYVISTNQSSLESVWSYPIKETVKSFVGEEYYILPKRWQRFHFSGGAQFIHGGLALQEISVPVITVRNSDQATMDRLANVQYVQAYLAAVSSRGYRITSNISKVPIRQSERISAIRLARDIEIYIRDEEGNIVSNRPALRLDSSEENQLPLEREVMLSLTGAGFDRNKRYLLIIEDDKGVQLEAYSVTIDLAFSDDFF